jgi:hypothetical protein
MPDNLPKALQEAMTRVLDAEADSERSPASAPPLERIRLLRAARAALSEWREGRLTSEQAVAHLDGLAKNMVEDSMASELDDATFDDAT